MCGNSMSITVEMWVWLVLTVLNVYVCVINSFLMEHGSQQSQTCLSLSKFWHFLARWHNSNDRTLITQLHVTVMCCRAMWVAGVFAASSSITYPAISAFVSSQANPDQQGKLSSWLFRILDSLKRCAWTDISLNQQNILKRNYLLFPKNIISAPCWV